MAEQYCVMTMAKRHRGDVKGLQAEANREYTDESKYKNKVDLSRTHENVYFVKSDDWQSSIDEVLEVNGIKENRNSVVLITSVYGMSPEWLKEHTEDEAMAYFEKCLEYERQTKGEVISAVVHKDETSWHMQVATVPVVKVQDVKCTPKTVKDATGQPVLDDNGRPVIEVYKKGKSKGKPMYERKPVYDAQGNPVYHVGLNAKTVFGNRVAMSKRQTEFYEVCGKPFGMVRGEIRVEDDEVAKERLTEAEYKASKMVEEAEEKVEEARMKSEMVEKSRQEVEDAWKALEDAQRALEASQTLFKRQRQESMAQLEKERTEAQKELEAYKTTRRQEVEQELEAEKQKRLESLKSATGAAYAAQSDYEYLQKQYTRLIEQFPEKLIGELNRKSVRVNGQSVPLGKYHEKAIREAVEAVREPDSETRWTEQTAKQNLDRVAMAEEASRGVMDKLNHDTGYGYER